MGNIDNIQSDSGDENIDSDIDKDNSAAEDLTHNDNDSSLIENEFLDEDSDDNIIDIPKKHDTVLNKIKGPVPYIKDCSQISCILIACESGYKQVTPKNECCPVCIKETKPKLVERLDNNNNNIINNGYGFNDYNNRLINIFGNKKSVNDNKNDNTFNGFNANILNNFGVNRHDLNDKNRELETFGFKY